MSSLARRCVAELLGTFTLVAIGPGAAMVAARTHAFGHLGVSLAFGLAVTLVADELRDLGTAVRAASGRLADQLLTATRTRGIAVNWHRGVLGGTPL